MIKLVILGELTTLNDYIDAERSNRHAGAKVKKENTEACLWQLKGSQGLQGRHRVAFTWFAENMKIDPDNIAFCKKYVLDAIVRAGILPNDGWKQIAGFSDDFQVDKGNPRVEVILEEVGA